jgi:NADP-dependent 3-hydroxy acid dehydrogenase YdfG
MKNSEKIAVVTGAGSGIGKKTAITLAKEGFSLALVGRKADRLKEVASEIEAIGSEALVVSADVTDPKSVADAFASIESRFGRIDVLFNNAGIAAKALPIDEVPVEEWLCVMNTNLNGSFLCAREAFRIMRKQNPQGGRIINNGSVSAHVPRLYSSPYTATKHGVTGLTRALSLDGRKFNIACGQIDIGNAQSDMTAKMNTGMLQANGEMIPEPTIDAQHIADAVKYMSSLPLNANVQFMTVMATQMPFIGRG